LVHASGVVYVSGEREKPFIINDERERPCPNMRENADAPLYGKSTTVRSQPRTA
jgi:hypothetical protein